MKILITTDWYSPVVNGVVTSVLNLRKQLELMGHEVRVLTLSRDGVPNFVDGTYYVKSFKVKVYPQARCTYQFLYNGYIRDILHWKPDIIHSQCEWITFLFAHRIAKKLNIPLVHTYHTIYDDYTHYFMRIEKVGKRVLRFGANYALSRSDLIVTPTEKVRELLLGYGVKTPIATVPTGIDLSQFYSETSKDELSEIKKRLGISPSCKVLVSVGRLAVEKNLDELIRNMRPLLKVMPEAVLLIVGGGPYENELHARVLELGLSDNVIFTGMILPEEVSKYYRLGDAFVCASKSEAQGLTYAEALACGCPSICKEDKCLENVIIDGFNGYAYHQEDDFVKKVQFLFADDLRYRQFCQNASESAKIFSAKVFAEKIETLYYSLLAPDS